MLQEQPFQVPRHSAQAALEVRLHHRLARVGPEALLAAVGEQPGQGDQTEVGEQLLLDRALGLKWLRNGGQLRLRQMRQRSNCVRWCRIHHHQGGAVMSIRVSSQS